MSLRVKIAVAMAAIAVVASASVGFIVFRTTEDRLVLEVDRSMAEAFAVAVDSARVGGRLPTRGLLEIYELRQLDESGRVSRGRFAERLPVTTEAAQRASRPGATWRETVEGDDEEYRVHTLGFPGGAFQLARSLDETNRVLDDLRRRTVLLVVLVAVGAAAVGALIAGSVAAPLRRLTRVAAEVGSTGRLDVPIPEHRSGDEVGVLGSAFGGMLGALAQSRAEQRRLVQDAGHELRTPLTSLRTNLSVLRRHERLDPAMTAEILAELDGEVGELTDLVNELVAAASGELAEQPPEPVDLVDVARGVADRVARRRNREVTVAAAPGAAAGSSTVLAPAAGIERAVLNLVENACKFDESGAPIEVFIDGGTLRVLDRGPGIPDADQPRVFDRFHRAETARTLPGSGLGLAIVRDVVERHGGSVAAQSRPGGGADVGFTLPVIDRPVLEQPVLDRPPLAPPTLAPPTLAPPTLDPPGRDVSTRD